MILVVDDDKNIRLSLKLILERNGYEVALAEEPKEAMQIVRNTPAVELVLMDMNYTRATDGEEGLTLLKQVKVFRPEVPCILMTAWGSIDLAVQGMNSSPTLGHALRSTTMRPIFCCLVEQRFVL